MNSRTRFLRNLAAAFVAGEWTAADMQRAGRRATNKRFTWVKPLAERLLAAFPQRPSFGVVFAVLEVDAAVQRACGRLSRKGEPLPVWCVFVPRAEMGAPPPALGSLSLPALATESALAEWLGVPVPKLLWYADVAGRNAKHPAGPMRTYRARWVAKRGGRARLLEVPNARLKHIQRKILADILNAIPPHDAAHGFRPGRSIITNAAPHCGKQIVLRFDVADFFPSVPAAKVFRLFRTVGYPDAVARLLTGLCTTRTPRDVWDARPNPTFDGSEHSAWLRVATRHLPQGAPTSPAVANLVAFRLDRRLAKLAAALEAEYTRYADDLAFSGGELLARGSKRFGGVVARIAAEEGFELNYRKSRAMRRGEQQRVAGVVVNVRPNVPRVEFDLLKAVLTNCVRHGPAGQNRAGVPDFRAHLAGRVSHVAAVNPIRGRMLWAIFDRIAWPG